METVLWFIVGIMTAFTIIVVTLALVAYLQNKEIEKHLKDVDHHK